METQRDKEIGTPNSDATRLYITNNGNVGIGTTSPGGKLEVNGASLFQNMVRFQGTDTVYAPSGSSGVGGELFTQAGNAYLQSYNRTTAAYTSLQFVASSFGFNIGYATFSAGHGDASSRALKTNITPIGNALDKVSQLNGVYFDWIASDKHDIGMIGEDVKNIIPEVVYEDNGSMALSYDRLVALLVEAVKAQQQQIQALKQDVSRLKGDL